MPTLPRWWPLALLLLSAPLLGACSQQAPGDEEAEEEYVEDEAAEE